MPFPLFEYQSKWIAGVLSGRLTLPSVEEMMEDSNSFYSKLDVSGIPKHYTHNLGDSQVDILSSTLYFVFGENNLRSICGRLRY